MALQTMSALVFSRACQAQIDENEKNCKENIYVLVLCYISQDCFMEYKEEIYNTYRLNWVFCPFISW